MTPDYSLGCKRLLLSNDWYPTLTAPNAEVLTAPIAEITRYTVLTTAGVDREIDTGRRNGPRTAHHRPEHPVVHQHVGGCANYRLLMPRRGGDPTAGRPRSIGS